MKLQILSLLILSFAVQKVNGQAKPTVSDLQWKPGYLDIHHINTRRGNATFLIFPDGTTMLYDLGDKKFQAGDTTNFPTPETNNYTPAKWVKSYIDQVMPKGWKPVINYLVISHFHDDHYGNIDDKSLKSNIGDYQLSGVTEIGDLISIKTIIDRDYPKYDYPVNLKSKYAKNPTFNNYLRFLSWNKANRELKIEKFVVGSNRQIKLVNNPKKYPGFSIRNIKGNQYYWTGKGNTTATYDFNPNLVDEKGDFNENPLSLGLKISYGAFNYYIGGDTPGYQGWPDFDMESTIAPIIGEIDILALNHHGYKDASNPFYLKTLNPLVVIQQAIHDPHFNPKMVSRLAANNFDVFTFNMHDYVLKNNIENINKVYKSTSGHIMIRVMPGGKRFHIYTFNDMVMPLKVSGAYGPYNTHEQ
jgi:hypothetical protein